MAFLIALIGLVLYGIHNPLWAQDLPESAPEILPQITVQAAPDLAQNADAASQGTLDGRSLNMLPVQRPAALLENVPGMIVTQHSGEGKANQYFLRGYNLDHGTDFATSVDGVPVNMPSNAHGQGYSDLNFLLPELVSRIDYRKGPYAPQNGDFSSAGSADIFYRNTLDKNLADLTMGAFGYRRLFVAGSRQLTGPGPGSTPANPTPSATGERNDGLGGLRTDLEGRADNTMPSVLGALEMIHNNGPWSPGDGYQKLNGLLRLGEGSSANGWSLDGFYYDAHWNSVDQVPQSLITSGQLGRYAALDPTDGGNTGRAILSGEWHQFDAQGYSRAQVWSEHYRLQLWSNFTFYELRPATGDQFEQTDNRWIYGGKYVRGWNHSLMGFDSTTEVGFSSRNDQAGLGLLNTQARVPFAQVRRDQVDETMLGTYLQNSTNWLDWLRTNAGLREDHVLMHLDALQAPNTSGSASGSIFSPKLSIIMGPWNNTEFFMDAGRGFHSNDARGVIDRVDPATGQAVTPVSPLVGTQGQELGVRTEVISGVQSALALWKLHSNSEIIYNADSTIGSTSPNGASNRSGVEWNNHVTTMQWLVLDMNLAWTRAHYVTMNDNGQLGNLIPNAVSKVALLELATRNLGAWEGSVETRYIGAYPLSQDGSLTAPSALVTNVRLQHHLGPGLDAFADVLNVFNREYYDIAYQQDYRVSPVAPVVPSGVTVHPGEPRQMRLTLQYTY